MKKENYLTILVLLLCIFPLMLNTDFFYQPGSSIEIRDKGMGTNVQSPLAEGRTSVHNDVSPSNKISAITGQITRGLISIHGDAAFISANGVSEGTGTESDPYIIANWFIDGNGGNCIRIDATTSYFSIENCTLINAYAGIILISVTNGYLRNNTCNTSNIGILLEGFSSSNTLTNNNCSSNANGIRVTSSDYNTLTQNTCNSNTWGISVSASDFNTFTQNTCNTNDFGISLSSSDYNSLTANVLSSNTEVGLYLSASTDNIIHSNWLWNNGIYDHNSLANNYVYENFFYPLGKYDVDHDGLTDEQEIALGTNPILVDTDEDNFMDGYEYAYGSDPLDSSNYPLLWQEDFDTLLMYLDGNATLLERVITWSEGNTTRIDAIIGQLEDNATLVQQVLDWLDDNATAITQLFTYLEGNATQLELVMTHLEGNVTLLETVYALASGNQIYLQTLNTSCITQFNAIFAIINQLGITVGDTDYDGLSDLEELTHGTSIVLMDTDCDNLNDAFEIKIGTDPLDDDSDGDNYLDGVEILAGTNPKNAMDFPGKTSSISSTTTTPTTLPSSSTDTSTSSKAGSYPNVFLILSMMCVCVIYLRKLKKD